MWSPIQKWQKRLTEANIFTRKIKAFDFKETYPKDFQDQSLRSGYLFWSFSELSKKSNNTFISWSQIPSSTQIFSKQYLWRKNVQWQFSSVQIPNFVKIRLVKVQIFTVEQFYCYWIVESSFNLNVSPFLCHSNKKYKWVLLGGCFSVVPLNTFLPAIFPSFIFWVGKKGAERKNKYEMWWWWVFHATFYANYDNKKYCRRYCCCKKANLCDAATRCFKIRFPAKKLNWPNHFHHFYVFKPGTLVCLIIDCS